MSAEERPVYPSVIEAAEAGVNTMKDAATDGKGVVIHPATHVPITTGERVEPGGDGPSRKE